MELNFFSGFEIPELEVGIESSVSSLLSPFFPINRIDTSLKKLTLLFSDCLLVFFLEIF